MQDTVLRTVSHLNELGVEDKSSVLESNSTDALSKLQQEIRTLGQEMADIAKAKRQADSCVTMLCHIFGINLSRCCCQLHSS